MSLTLGVHAVTDNAGIAPTNSGTTGGVTTQAKRSTFVIALNGFNVAAGGPGTPTVTDSKGNTYHRVVVGGPGAGAQSADVYVCENGVGGAGHTVTADWGSATFFCIFLAEIKSSISYAVRDQTPAVNDDTSSPYSSNSATTRVADEFLFAFGGTGSAVLATDGEVLDWTGSTFTGIDTAAHGNTTSTGGNAFRIVSAVGTYTASFTSTGGGTDEAEVALVTFYEAPPDTLFFGSGTTS